MSADYINFTPLKGSALNDSDIPISASRHESFEVISSFQIAHMLGLSHDAVKQAMEQLSESKAIRISKLVDARKISSTRNSKVRVYLTLENHSLLVAGHFGSDYSWRLKCHLNKLKTPFLNLTLNAL